MKSGLINSLAPNPMAKNFALKIAVKVPRFIEIYTLYLLPNTPLPILVSVLALSV